MVQFAVAVIIELCLAIGVSLRYAPFANIIFREKKRLLYVIYAIGGILNVALMTVLFTFWGLSLSISYLLVGGTVYVFAMSFVNIIVIKGKLQEHIFVLGVVHTCHYLMLSIPSYITSLIIGLDDIYHLFLVLGVYLALLLITYPLFFMLLKRTIEPFLYLDTGSYWHTIFFIPIAYFGAVVTILLSSDTVDNLMQLVSSCFSGSVIVLMCLTVSSDNKRMYERQALEKQITAQKLHYSEMKMRVQEARRMRHDFKHHVAAIRNYMELDDKVGLKDYCDDFLQRTSDQGSMPYTGNVAADGVLYHYMQIAHEKGVELQYLGTLNSNGISDMDICVLLGNALDNAMTACAKLSSNKSIQVIIQSEEKMLTIVVRNTFDGKIEQGSKGILSAKRESGYGVGMSSMRSVCERYGGSMDVSWDADNFSVMFMLPINNQKDA